MNYILGRIWKEIVATQFRHLRGAAEENNEKRQDGRFLDHELNPGSPEYETGVLITRQQLPVEAFLRNELNFIMGTCECKLY
jgi:hypothetical protein